MVTERWPERKVGAEQELKGVPLDLLQEHFVKLYGRRNEVYLDSRVRRIDFLNIALGDLQDAIRKGSEPLHLKAMFARLPSRIFCIAHGLNNISVTCAMVEKYPKEGCAYCANFPCRCGDRRPEVTLGEWHPDSEQANWSLADWQQHLNRLYGARNKEKGIENIFNRLFKEISELMSLEHSIDRASLDMDEIEHEYGLELADCLAWTIAAANFYNVDLEQVVLRRYATGCGKCKQNPCICINFSFQQIRAQEERN